MNNEPLFSASYADWKLIKTRNTVQIVFEIPVEASDHAYRVLGGMPKFDAEEWFAVARMKEPKES